MTRQRSQPWWAKITRDLVLFTLGLIFAVNEVLIRDGEPRREVILFTAYLIGAPLALRHDEKRRRRK